MKKTKYNYAFRIYKHYITEWEEDIKLEGIFRSTATSERKAINNICWREGFRNHYGADYTIKYTYKLPFGSSIISPLVVYTYTLSEKHSIFTWFTKP